MGYLNKDKLAFVSSLEVPIVFCQSITKEFIKEVPTTMMEETTRFEETTNTKSIESTFTLTTSTLHPLIELSKKSKSFQILASLKLLFISLFLCFVF